MNCPSKAWSRTTLCQFCLQAKRRRVSVRARAVLLASSESTELPVPLLLLLCTTSPVLTSFRLLSLPHVAISTSEPTQAEPRRPADEALPAVLVTCDCLLRRTWTLRAPHLSLLQVLHGDGAAPAQVLRNEFKRCHHRRHSGPR